MNKANQKVVMQNANMTLVQIRQFEISYFQIFFSNFGTQAALMIGFIAGSLSQVPGWDNPPDAPYFFVVLYWVTSALSLCFGMHCLVCTVFINVYGQGLALRGPPGSMVRAIKGMIAEQRQILICFLIAIFTFGFQCIGMYWIMMDNTSAIVCSVITAICIVAWYRYALRLYNRFSWNGINVDWLGDDSNSYERNPQEQLDELNPNLASDVNAKASKYQQANQKSIKDFSSTKKTVTINDPNNKDNSTTSASPLTMTTNPLLTGSKKVVDVSDTISLVEGADHMVTSADLAPHRSLKRENITSLQQGGGVNSAGGSGNDKEPALTFGSYLTVKERGRLGVERWKRRYFIIKGNHIFYFKDKRAFELEPSKPVNQRAIDLEGYTLVAGSVEAPYPISLVPYESDDIRKVWKFRCDTSSEFERWIQLFSIALSNCNPQKSQGELIIMGADGKSEVVTVVDDDEDQTNYSGDDR